jgi:peptidyl-prolyl cis-trans isomerase A (cyclophilin A)
MTSMSTHTATAVIKTNHGPITVNLFGNHAPKTVANFIGLATGDKEWTDPATGEKRTDSLYAGTVFHRIIAGFIVRTSCPPNPP